MQEIIYEKNIKERIDSFLSSNFSYSRNFFHHIIERKWVLVNWKAVKKSYKLKENDKIQIDNLERYLDSSFLEELPFIDIPIILEKEDYLVINKPKWVLSHPNSIWDLSAPSVVAFLYQKYKNLPSIWNFIRAGLVHRLDKDTDGLMIVAKTEKWLEYFKNLFNKKSQLVDNILKELNLEKPDYSKLEKTENEVWLKKFYRAIVNITKKWESFLNNIDFPYYITEIVKPKVAYPGEYKMGITKILNISQAINKKITDNDLAAEGSCCQRQQIDCDWKQDCLWYINLQIITWRTHQIRYHLSNKWLPIIWDKLYWNKEEIPMQLTAYKLEFVDLNGEKMLLEI